MSHLGVSYMLVMILIGSDICPVLTQFSKFWDNRQHFVVKYYVIELRVIWHYHPSGEILNFSDICL